MDTKELAIYKRQATEVKKKAGQLKITSQAKVVEAQDFRKKIATAIKLVKGKRDEIVKPLRVSIKKTQELFNPIIDEMTATDVDIKMAMEKYVRQQQLIIEEKKKEIEQKVDSGEISFEKAGKKIEKAESKVNAVKTRNIQEVIITDTKKVPDEYYVIDMVKLRKDALAGIKIAGVKVESKTIVVN
jgi:hypothetical protein